MALGKDTVMLQTAVHRDVERKIRALSEKMGLKPSAVVAFAVNELADARGIVLREEIDPRQVTIPGMENYLNGKETAA